MGIIFDDIEGDDNIIPLTMDRIYSHPNGGTLVSRANTYDGVSFYATRDNKLLNYEGYGVMSFTQFAINAIKDSMLKFVFVFKKLEISYAYRGSYNLTPSLCVGLTADVNGDSDIHEVFSTAGVSNAYVSIDSMAFNKGKTNPLFFSNVYKTGFRIFFAGSIFSDYPVSYSSTVSYTGTMYSGADAYMIPIWGMD